MLKRFIHHIENTPWEHEIRTQERILNRVIWVIIILAVLYFIPPCIKILWGQI